MVWLWAIVATFLLASCECGGSTGAVGADAGVVADAGGEEGGSWVAGRRLETPLRLELDLGAVRTVTVELAAGEAPWATTVVVEAPRHSYVAGRATGLGAVGVGSIDLQPGEEGEVAFEIQTLLTWDHEITVSALGESRDVPVTVHPVAPFIGLGPYGCDGPHVVHYGPDCGLCGAETTDRDCALAMLSETCHPNGLRIPDDGDEESALATCNAGEAFASQMTRAIPASFGDLATARGEVDVGELDWIAGTLQAAARARPMPSPGVLAWWMGTCTDCANADGTRGPYDPENALVMDALFALGDSLGAVDGVIAVELADQQAALDWLCPCTLDGSACSAPSGPSQPACGLPDPLYSEELGQTYGDLVAAVLGRVGAGVHAARPEAIAVGPPIDVPSRGLSPLTLRALEAGLADGIDALGVAASPYPPPTWIEPMPDCAAGEDGCETAPPLEDWTVTQDGEPRVQSSTQAWRALDREIDPEEIVDALAAVGHGELPLWYTSMRAGFHGEAPREVLAGFRIAAIVLGRGAVGLELAFPPADPGAYDLLVRTFTGATPVARPGATADYDGLVLRFFTRGDEDTIVAWSNGEAATAVTILSAEGARGPLTVTRLRAGVRLEIGEEPFLAATVTVPLLPLSEVLVVRTRSQAPSFGWLSSIVEAAPVE